MKCQELLKQGLRLGQYDAVLEKLYGREKLGLSRERARYVTDRFNERFYSPAPAVLFSGPGRTELGGNHTDHQHGRALCGSVDMDMLACAAPNGQQIVRICSEGYSDVEIDLGDLNVCLGETGTSAALVRGVAAGIGSLGYSLSGFDACIHSTVLSGSGLSSSAAYEILISCIFNHFFCQNRLTSIKIAKIGQYAENVYFGKPSGLMDQIGASVGGVVTIDFEKPADPQIRRIDYDFAGCGHTLCIVDTGSDHADLTGEYAAVAREMSSIAQQFGKTCLRDVPEQEFLSDVPALRKKCGDRAVLRARHFYSENRRAAWEAEALETGDFTFFLKLVNASGLSSVCDLQNIWAPAHPECQAVSLALSIGRSLLGEEGAVRVHGGGFAGTIQAFVPNDRLEYFRTGMEEVFGNGRCHVTHIRSVGGCVVTD